MRLSERFTLVEFNGRIKELDEICTIKKLKVNRSARIIKLNLFFSDKFDNAVLSELFGLIKNAYRLSDISAEVCVNKSGPEAKKDDAPAQAPAEEKKEEKNNDEKKLKEERPKEEKPPKDESVIFGSAATMPVTKMAHVNADSGEVAVRGEVFFCEVKVTKKGRTIIVFDITDKTNSVRVKKLLPKAAVEKVTGAVKKGKSFIVQGVMGPDKFTGESVLDMSGLTECEKTVRLDPCEEKRVELHLHTQMSALDATNSIDDFCAAAKLMGHKAIAVTDHGVLQAYPDAMKASKKHGIKILYGVEAYFVNDIDGTARKIVDGNKNEPLSGEYIVFDFETTGLSRKKDRITEIGAVKVSGGEITDTFSTFVNPHMPIPPKITELTGITDEMVKDAPDENEAVRAFLKFSGSGVMVAHNAPFDMGFLNEAKARLGIKTAQTSIDTVELSRTLYPNLKNHKLDTLARHLEMEDFNHHRACDDANVLAGMFIKMTRELRDEYKIETTGQINALSDGAKVKTTSLKSYHQIIFAKDYTGLKNLYKLVSWAHIDDYYKRPRILKSKLMAHREGLIIGSACVAGELYSAILDGADRDRLINIAQFYDFLEIQPLDNNRFLIGKGRAKDEEELKAHNKLILSLGDELSIPVAATGDVHFLNPEDEIFRRILMSGHGFDDEESTPLYYRTTKEMLDEFSYLGERDAHRVVIENTNLIADMMEPIRPIAEGSFPPNVPNAAEDLEKIVWTRAKEIYGEDLPNIVSERIEHEMTPIIKHGFAPMYTIAQKLVLQSNEAGYLVGSRGSVGSSFVAFLDGITEVNSLAPHYLCEKCKHVEFFENGEYGSGADMPPKDCPNCGIPMKKDGFDIPFETFLGFDGDKSPDIDLNFSSEYQATAHKNTEVMFGKGFVYRAGTIGTLKEKKAYGYVKHYLEETGVKVNRAEENRLIMGCTGSRQSTGQHPGGLIVVPSHKEIYDFCPIQRPANNQKLDIITTHFEYHSIEENLLKLDLLGHDAPTMIRVLTDLTGVDINDVRLDDEETMSIFTSPKALKLEPDEVIHSVGTVAIPEFGTKFVRQMLVDTKPTTFAELVRIAGLSHGTDVWLNNAQQLVLDGTTTLKNVISTRDDIMMYLIHKGLPKKESFTIMEAVRKGKGLQPEWVELMQSFDVPEWYIESCRRIKYMFPKAHAVAYVLMSFRIAYFKVHYPLAFYCAYFSVAADDFDADMMANGIDRVRRHMKKIEQDPNATAKDQSIYIILEICYEMYRRGFEFLPIDLYESDSKNFKIIDGKILPPFRALSGLGENAARSIKEAREDRPFETVEDLRVRTGISKTVIEMFRERGMLRGIPESNQTDIFDLLKI
ncbi:MAG: PolC-type DNA polymerase III [Clostridia bacterium]|nr:PolC-type DNA polymerase III [Clostridia bacterium]